jgi:MoaA/NifB/PqqE/SkfB family radical SAM enzyme
MSRTSQEASSERKDEMKTVDRSVGAFFGRGIRVSVTRPWQAWQFARTIRWQAAAAKTRRAWRAQGVMVPPIIIFSITHQCNLQCAGCYAQAFLGATGATECAPVPAADGTGEGIALGRPVELSDSKLDSIVTEAAEIGVSFFVIAGGEPFMREELLAIAQRFPRVIFLVFTNGLLLTEQMVERITRLKNIVPLLSLEGTAAQTDQRRGQGTYEQLVGVMARLRARGQFFGCSLTLTRQNCSTILAADYVGGLFKAGCRFFLLADYTPVELGTEDWVLTAEQHCQVEAQVRRLRRRYKAIFVAVPWDEQEVGGCLSAGRGFVHINASGEVEPCPFAPYSDADLTQVSLLEALKSPFLERLRAMPDLSTYEGGGCGLWKHRTQVEEALAEVLRNRG